MTPAARVQAAIELLDAIVRSACEGGAAADTLIARYFKTRRYAGPTDRRAIRKIVFRAIRRAGERPASGRAAMIGLAREDPDLRALFDGSTHAPAPITADERGADPGRVPDWIRPRLDPLIDDDELQALLERATLDLRVNRLKATRDALLAELPEAQPTPHSPLGLRLAEGRRIEDLPAWHAGGLEIQDEGSQLICLACRATPGDRVVDLCAGAGGKTLAVGAEMQGQGLIIAADVDRQRLSRMHPRLQRAGLSIVEERLLDPKREAEQLTDIAGTADIVLVDAPCSGSGTWRRNPEARWRLSPARLERLIVLQVRLLGLAATLVRPGGTLVYAVCSVLREEGRDQARAFQEHSSVVPIDSGMRAGRPAGPGTLLTPGHDGTDGFFVARWQRP